MQNTEYRIMGKEDPSAAKQIAALSFLLVKGRRDIRDGRIIPAAEVFAEFERMDRNETD